MVQTTEVTPAEPRSQAPAPRPERSSQEIREEIERTRAQMDEAFDRLEGGSTGGLLTGLLDALEDSPGAGLDRMLQIARNHPWPAALIGLGFTWLLLETARRSKSSPEPAAEVYGAASPLSGEVDNTIAYLHSMGLEVQPKELPSLLEEALVEMRRTLYPPDPAADLPAAETAALRRGGFHMAPSKSEGPNALTRTAVDFAALRETSLAANETAQRLKVDPSRVRQLLAARKIYGLQVKGAWKIPAFQFEGGRLLPGLEEVVPRLPKEIHPVAVYRWFMHPNPDLVSEDEQELSPRDWLLAGYPPQAVAELAIDLDNL